MSVAMHTRDAPRLRHADRLFIDGAWRFPVSGGLIDVVSPDTDQIVMRVAEAGNADMDAAVDAARRAFDEGPWPRVKLSERLDRVRVLATELEKREHELCSAWTMQMGGLASVAPFIIGNGTANILSTLAVAEVFPFEQRVASGAAPATLLVYEPVGVVAAIVPWNVPYGLMTCKIAPALVAGCTVVMKPAPETPVEAYIIAECADIAGFPPGVINLVTGHRAASDHLVQNAGVDKVSFTGSTAAGRRIASVCAERMARCTLELGGKSAAIVLEDFGIEEAATVLARTITMVTGQVCSILSRALVPRSQHDALASAIAARMAEVRVGYSIDAGTQMGPLASRRQLERVEAYIRKGVEEGATLVTGGGRPAHLDHGCFIAPTLFANVHNTMTIAQEEIFGPVLCLIPYDGVDDAVRMANDTIYGLNGAVLTHDAEAAYRIGRRIRSGRFAQNGLKADGALPSGGFRQSGIGREGGEAGLRSYLESKVLFLDRMPDNADA